MIHKLKTIYAMLADLWRSRQLIIHLSVNDFKTRYAGSLMGVFWAFVQPIITVLVYWFVFEKGLRAGAQAMGGLQVPFVLFLLSGLVPWFFFSDAWPNGTSSLLSYSYLVKKVVFKISILPIVKVVASIYVHMFFVAVTLVIFWAYGYAPDLYSLQVVYYSFAMFVLVLGLSYITASVVGFFRDLTEIINILMQILVWVTPIMWNVETAISDGPLKTALKLNPMYYIVSGYRNALINKQWFWQTPRQMIYFWVVALLVLGLGMLVFKRLKNHFADVL